ncbi:hypothetical protein THIOM_005066 [Candidatus Thiomargarita nelsonii]|uniref:Uncharacterized protein n=1 Tax=Candidatus Thiomargarita nelsonii TaxID=1003181 RepID=A0A176RU97_9GAMM|nr:hypothetical protein THIOM_005066 [Candidatus Thiomargarita nelsonii]
MDTNPIYLKIFTTIIANDNPGLLDCQKSRIVYHTGLDSTNSLAILKVLFIFLTKNRESLKTTESKL